MSAAAKIPPITMSKLYVGNLPNEADETVIRQLFYEQSLACTEVLVKRGGYAFVDCPDQSSADRAIDKLNNFNFNGSSLIVEPSVASGRKMEPVVDSPGTQVVGNGWFQTSKVIVSNVPSETRFEDVEYLFRGHGCILSCERLASKDSTSQTFAVTYELNEEAERAVGELDGFEIDERIVRVALAVEKRPRRSSRGARSSSSSYGNSSRPNEVPLRILVRSEMVGAIIGRQGATIRKITQQTRARVDVHRKDNVGSLEKAVTIYGSPDSCTIACRGILEVMQQEATSTNKGDVTLKILAHNNLIGRVIGKSGNNIKKIMQESGTKITVSSISEINSFNLERIITVKGPIENMSLAEYLISSKLRQSYENDLQTMVPQTMMFPGLHPMALMATSEFGYGTRNIFNGHPPYPGLYGNNHAGGDSEETTYLYVPNNVVGAIIGTKGCHIRTIIKFSGASVKISRIDDSTGHPGPRHERKVTIVGSPESQWRAQYLIYEKIKEEGFVSSTDEIRLTTEIVVPTSQVGRIIGKGGRNVRELQRVTGSVIKLPDLGPEEDETPVHIAGSFLSVQSAQRRIRALMLQVSFVPQDRPRSLRYNKSSTQSETTSSDIHD